MSSENGNKNMLALRRQRREQGLCATCARPSSSYRCSVCRGNARRRVSADDSYADADSIGAIDDVLLPENDYCGGKSYDDGVPVRLLQDVLLEEVLFIRRKREESEGYQVTVDTTGPQRSKTKVFYTCDERPGARFTTHEVSCLTGKSEGWIRSTIAYQLQAGRTAHRIAGYTFRRIGKSQTKKSRKHTVAA